MTRSYREQDWSSSIAEFTGVNSSYYQGKFADLFEGSRARLRPNWAAAIVGPLWAASRGLFGAFLVAGLVEIALVIGIVFLSTGGLSVDNMSRAQSLEKLSEARLTQANDERQKGNEAAANQMQELSKSLAQSAANERAVANDKARAATMLIVSTIAGLLGLRAIFAVAGDWLYSRQYMRWRRDRATPSRRSYQRVVACGLLLVIIYVVALFGAKVPQLASTLAIQTNTSELAGITATALDRFFTSITQSGRSIFDAITGSISALVASVESLLEGLPWICTILVVVFAAWLLAGSGTAAFTGAGLVYLALFGFWQKSMVTIALLGTAAVLALSIGIPLGIICGKSPRAYRIFRPMLDLMQTMPAFIYLVPIIAFFGIGKTPGVLATIIFGMPPVARLTALGLQQVPLSIREAAVAFGATPWQSLVKVELPLAMPSIMAGINQTILMCLSMVVIASLIGAGGLGEDVLQALQFASVGQGFLVGAAVLICAIILDRLIQGKRSNNQ
ncbi:proline/glycine betaine ABC transporter permease [Mesorhizobium sp. NZP2077]|uniref:ABC transporter permease n=1 Tax=Mesorhizobium sp. NZP2077 TaxID=2483404 RepID=UPI001557536A|nr:proline/glycine betaine ABC transporter permease [Mesorhizobium sp. NZP2077]QKC86861.1 proline/glycine betaine ABC transporter permease [Mesorhizobium sp. NZP2077]QKD20566.1 proline/glycine betaine ABC transporter permease [Mesorhizobium sp. NZP2077]